MAGAAAGAVMIVAIQLIRAEWTNDQAERQLQRLRLRYTGADH